MAAEVLTLEAVSFEGGQSRSPRRRPQSEGIVSDAALSTAKAKVAGLGRLTASRKDLGLAGRIIELVAGKKADMQQLGPPVFFPHR